MILSLDEDAIVWPGGLLERPTGLMIPTHLKVLTVVEQPFVYARRLQVAGAGGSVGGNLGSFLGGSSDSTSSGTQEDEDEGGEGDDGGFGTAAFAQDG